jgi:hypothetical protein
MKKAIYLSLSLLLIFSKGLFAQNLLPRQTIRGIIIDEQSNQPLSGVTIRIETLDAQPSSISTASGAFNISEVPVGRHRLRISRVGYEESVINNIEVTSTKEIVLELRLREKVQVLNEVVVTAGKSKFKALNESTVVSARQLSMDEAVRYSGTRNDPSRMAQNFAGVSGPNDARNDIVIRGNSPSGVLWRMDGIDIPNPNHYSTVGSTGGPVTILNTNTLKNSDFITSAFPAQYGNAVAGVFDLRMRNGNAEKTEWLGQMGFNGFELGVEGPLGKNKKSSYLFDYRYSLVAAIQAVGLNVGTGTATPYYQDINFKLHLVTKKHGTFDWFGLGGESHITFPADSTGDNLYTTNDGKARTSNNKSLTGVVGMTHTYFFTPTASGKLTLALSGFKSTYREQVLPSGKPNQTVFDVDNRQTKASVGYLFNKKFSAKNQLVIGGLADFYGINLQQQSVPDGDSVLRYLTQSDDRAALYRIFFNWGHRFSNQLSTNVGLYTQLFSLNQTSSIEPRWNLKYQFKPNQSFNLGLGLHSQLQPMQVYFYKSQATTPPGALTNKNLDFVKSFHAVAGYDWNLNSHMRIKTEVYSQYIYRAAVEKISSSFSMLNEGSGFNYADKVNLINNGQGRNLGWEITLERFLHKGFYYLVTGSIFRSEYQGSDGVWRNTAFNSGYVANMLGGKEWKVSGKNTFGIDTRFTVAGGQRYTPFDIAASKTLGYVVYKENEAFSLQNNTYLRWDLKFSYTRNGKKTTQKWYIDLQNLTNRANVYIRSLNPSTGKVSEINQIGFFPNINYQITF